MGLGDRPMHGSSVILLPACTVVASRLRLHRPGLLLRVVAFGCCSASADWWALPVSRRVAAIASGSARVQELLIFVALECGQSQPACCLPACVVSSLYCAYVELFFMHACLLYVKVDTQQSSLLPICNHANNEYSELYCTCVVWINKPTWLVSFPFLFFPLSSFLISMH